MDMNSLRSRVARRPRQKVAYEGVKNSGFQMPVGACIAARLVLSYHPVIGPVWLK